MLLLGKFWPRMSTEIFVKIFGWIEEGQKCDCKHFGLESSNVVRKLLNNRGKVVDEFITSVFVDIQVLLHMNNAVFASSAVSRKEHKTRGSPATQPAASAAVKPSPQQ